MKTAIIIDSTCYMSEEDFFQRDYKVIPLSVNFKNSIHKENIYLKNQGKKIFEEIYELEELPTTSQPNPSDILAKFEEIAQAGYDKIISLHISEELSGTTQGIRTIAEQFLEDSDYNIQIEVYSTKSAAQVSGVIANEIYDIVHKEGDISSEEIKNIIDYYRQNTEVYFCVDDLNFLHFGGRIPKVLATTGNILGLTPILTLNENGGIEKFKTERSQKKAIKTIVELLKNKNYTKEDNIILIAAHVQKSKKSAKLLKLADDSTDANIIKTENSEIGIVIGNHLGTGAFALGWVHKYHR